MIKSNFTDVKTNRDYIPTRGNFGIEVGANLKFTYKDKITIISGGSIKYLSWKIVSKNELLLANSAQNAFYIKIPLQIEYPLSDEWILFGGLWGGYLVNADHREKDFGYKNDRIFYKKTPFGASLGVNFLLNNNMILTGDYSYGINSIYAKYWANTKGEGKKGRLHLLSLE